MTQLRNFVISILCLSLSLPVPAAPTPTKKEIEAVYRFFYLVDKPEPRSYRQILQTMKPFAPAEIVEHLESKIKDRLDEQAPKYELFDKGDHLELKYGTGSNVYVLTLMKKDPKIFARLRGVDLLHSDVADGWSLVRKIETAMKDKPKTVKGAMLWIERAEAFDWALGIGLTALAAGIGFGLYSLSRSKIKVDVPSNFNVNANAKVDVPSTYTLNVPNNYTVNTNSSFTAPQLDKLTGSGQK